MQYQPSRRLYLGVLLLALTMFVAGCRSDGNGDATPSTTPSGTGATGAPGAAPTEFPDRIAPPVPLTGNSCVDWPLVHERSVVAITGNGGQVRRHVPQYLNDIAKFQQSVGPAQRSDVEIFANAWNAVGVELQRINYDLLTMATDPAAQKAIQGTGSPEVVAAMTRLDKWSETTCPAPKPSATPAR